MQSAPQDVKVPGKWCRFVLRMHQRALWAAQGVFLWLLQRPYLRYLPLPYPSTSTVEKWLSQAEQQVSQKTLSSKHLDFAWKNWRYNMANLGECIHLRGRLGLRTAFCEDPLLDGMLQAIHVKGLASRVKKAAHEEALAEARLKSNKVEREEEARTLIGPKGGLPTLRRDLVKLAGLLHVEMDEKDTIETLKEKVRPIVNVLKEKPKPSKPATAVKSAPQPKAARPKTLPMSSTASSVTAENRPITMLSDQMAVMNLEIQSLKEQLRLEQKRRRSAEVINLVEVDMKSESESDLSERAKQGIAEGMAEINREKLEAQYGGDVMDLTLDEIQKVVDP